ncbi:MAG TPA: hypothetical protein VJ829_12545, partial [Candidatus Binatia bacterium]|nr:hypothetical protein [Candidatus Binatia bacterium]
HALREGRTVARNVTASVLGGSPRPFRFSTLGQLATIGRRTAVANVVGIRFSGFVAWWLWRTIYLSKLPRLEKKVRVALAKDFACTAPPSPAAGAGVRVEITAPGRALAGAGAS